MSDAVTSRLGSRGESAALWLIALVLCWGVFALTGRAGLNVFDEGYLWYGVLRTLEGAVPLRDFQSYDPGRYYWCAAWALLFGDGIVGVRAALTAFQTLGVGFGLLAARRVTSSYAAQVGVGILLVAWMFPRFKLIEPSLAMLAVLLTMRLLEDPSRRRHLVLGLSLGLTAWFGRNHGLYCGIGQLLALGLLHVRHPGDADSRHESIRCFATWVLGVFAGYSPMFAMLLFIPDYAPSLFASTTQLTPLPTPIPWPWVVLSGGGGSFAAAIGYVVMAVAFPVCGWFVWRLPKAELEKRALFVAATCIGVGYIHNATSRAGLMHFAQSIHPMLLMLLAAVSAGRPSLGRWKAWLLGAVVAAVSAGAVVGGYRPQLEALAVFPYTESPTATYTIAGDTLQLEEVVAQRLERVEAAVNSRIRSDEPLLVIPYHVIYYPLLDRRSPVWGIFYLRPGQGESDSEMIARLEREGVDWVLFTSMRLSGLPGTFSEIRPKVMQYLRTNFRRVRAKDLPPAHFLMHRRTRGPSQARGSGRGHPDDWD